MANEKEPQGLKAAMANVDRQLEAEVAQINVTAAPVEDYRPKRQAAAVEIADRKRQSAQEEFDALQKMFNEMHDLLTSKMDTISGVMREIAKIEGDMAELYPLKNAAEIALMHLKATNKRG